MQPTATKQTEKDSIYATKFNESENHNRGFYFFFTLISMGLLNSKLGEN